MGSSNAWCVGTIIVVFVLDTITVWIRIAIQFTYFSLVMLSYRCYTSSRRTTSPSNNQSPDLNNPVQLENQDTVTSLQSVQVDASIPEGNQLTCPSYDALYELNKPPPTYEQSEAMVIDSGSQKLTEVNPVGEKTCSSETAAMPTLCPGTSLSSCNKGRHKKKTCQVVDNSIPEVIKTSQTLTDAVITVDVCSVGTDGTRATTKQRLPLASECPARINSVSGRGILYPDF